MWISSSAKVIRGDDRVYLSAREIVLLSYLLQHQGRIVSKEEIMKKVFGFWAYANTNIVEVYINHPRNKLNCGSKKPPFIPFAGKVTC
ncbi:MAG: winged helix-turn-helix domain-containing protein [candidate division KSB1 bacterium]|nr:winged helix-turn-helix domain-containing protein [candidate division KSB1 bacterium]